MSKMKSPPLYGVSSGPEIANCMQSMRSAQHTEKHISEGRVESEGDLL